MENNSTSTNDYFGINRIISLVLLIIPITAWILGFITRFYEQKYVAGVIRVIFGGWILWISDIICTIMNECNVKICRCLAV